MCWNHKSGKYPHSRSTTAFSSVCYFYDNVSGGESALEKKSKKGIERDTERATDRDNRTEQNRTEDTEEVYYGQRTMLMHKTEKLTYV